MESIVYLTRHGETAWNLEKRLQGWGDSPLTPAGIKNAENLKTRIEKLHIDIIFSSTSKRAVVTAEILRGEKSIPIVRKEGLKEMGFGKWEGLKWDEIEKSEKYSKQLYNLYNHPEKYVPFEGETLSEFSKRTRDTIDEILSEGKGKKILIITHGITMKMIMSIFKGISPEEAIKWDVVGQTSLTKIVYKEGKTYIEFENDTSHYESDYVRAGW
ncbi:MAG: histidine phosphatase family protein [Clostridiaceae bacterium]